MVYRHFTRADHVEVDERKHNRSIEMPRQMKINIDRCTQIIYCLNVLTAERAFCYNFTLREKESFREKITCDWNSLSRVQIELCRRSSHNQPSTDTRPSSSIEHNRSTTIDNTPRTSIDTVSSMSLGGSQWCRPMSMNSHRSTDHDEDRWTDNSSHRSTSSAKSNECNAVRILTHEEFAAKHPHPPSPFYDKIDRSAEPTIDRQSEFNVDRHNTPPIDRQAPLIYRVRLPSIDNDYINALKPPPKPLEPVQEDQETEGRRLRKRKEKIPKKLKREANEKEMDGFTKRILRIPIEKPFDEAYFTHRLWMFFRETKVTEEDIRRMFHQVREKMRQWITLTKKRHFTRADHVEVDKRKNNRSMRISAIDRHLEMPRQMKINIDRCTQVPSIDVETLDTRHFGSSGLKTQGQEKLRKCPDDFTLREREREFGEKITCDWNSLKELGFIGACHCGAEYESEYKIENSESIDTPTFPSIDSNESTVTDDRNNTSLDVDQPVDHSALPNHCYPHLAFQPPSKRGRDDYSIGSWADSDFHESFTVDTVITSPNEEHTEEYDDDYWKERAIEMSLHDERFETDKFTNTFPTSLDDVHFTSVDTHPRPAKQPLTSIDTHTETSIDIRAAAKIKEQENILSPTRDPDGNACAMDGRILQVSKEDIADILQVANGPANLFSQQCGTPDVIQTDPNRHVGVAATEINPYLSRQPKGHASIDRTTQTSIDRVTPTSIDKDDPTSIDRRYEFGHRALDMYGARKFIWERRDEYGVYRYEFGHARGDDIRKLLERASLFEESHICLPEHATSFTLTRLAPELYTKNEINEIVTGICGAQEKLGVELKSLVEDTHQPLDRGYNELFRSMVEMRTKIESLRQQLEKEATTSASIDAPHAPSIDVSLPTAHIPAEPQSSAEHKDEWEVSYINTRINDVYYPLNNNVDWLNTKIKLLQQDLDTIRKKDQQPATSIDANSFSIDRLRGPWIDGMNPVELLPYTAAEVDKITSKIYTAIDTMEERLDKRCDDMYFPFDNRSKEVKAIQRQLAAQHQISASIDKKGLTELSAYAYNNIGWYQVSIDNVQDRLQHISNVLEKMDDKLTRNDEATRSFIASWSRMCRDDVDACFPTSSYTTIDAKPDQPINYTLALNRSTRGRTIDRCTSSGVDRHQEMPRQMKINIDRCTQVPSIDVETLDMRHFGSSGLEALVQAKLRKYPDEESFLLQFYFERERESLERRSLLKGHFTRAGHVEVDERKNNRSMRISAVDRYQEMPRKRKINIDRCTQVPSIDVETSDTRHFGSSRLKTQGQAKLPKCPDEETFFVTSFILREREESFGEKITCDWNSLFSFLFIYTMSFYFFIVMNCFAMSE
ncbi:hypothetical protein IGI04_019391 [Brassica rapa subsp. trilocularis]|uniref:Uncharacterized protein n=1 Tax=Brassica rapa subsp. trilocularis TaxID=1813537 RepID=A0ABQ7MFP2_BRACM|nr:hypothetical protein IGI04_019391 [Brassica rapa subsp. trilocularis]